MMDLTGEALQKTYRDIQANLGIKEAPLWMDLDFREREVWEALAEERFEVDDCVECCKLEEAQDEAKELRNEVVDLKKQIGELEKELEAAKEAPAIMKRGGRNRPPEGRI